MTNTFPIYFSSTSSTRDQITKDLKKLKSSPPEAFLNKAVKCHLRMSSVAQKIKEKCKLCTVHDKMKNNMFINLNIVMDCT